MADAIAGLSGRRQRPAAAPASAGRARGAIEIVVEEGLQLVQRQFRQHRLDRTDRGRRHRDRAVAEADQRHRRDRFAGQFAAERHRRVVARAGVGDLLQHPQERHRQRVEAVGQLRVAAIDRHDELEQIVGADRDEVDRLHQLVELEQQRRHFQHGAELEAGRQMMGEARQMPHLAVDDLARLRDLAELRHHRQHQLQFAPAGRLQQGADLRPAAGPDGRASAGSPASRAPGFLPAIAPLK